MADSKSAAGARTRARGGATGGAQAWLGGGWQAERETVHPCAARTVTAPAAPRCVRDPRNTVCACPGVSTPSLHSRAMHFNARARARALRSRCAPAAAAAALLGADEGSEEEVRLAIEHLESGPSRACVAECAWSICVGVCLYAHAYARRTRTRTYVRGCAQSRALAHACVLRVRASAVMRMPPRAREKTASDTQACLHVCLGACVFPRLSIAFSIFPPAPHRARALARSRARCPHRIHE